MTIANASKFPSTTISGKLNAAAHGQKRIKEMPSITIPFLPKQRLLEFLQTQCQVDSDSAQGPFANALDLDLTHIDTKAAVEALFVTDLMISAETVVVSYDVHYRIFDGCKGVNLTSYLDKKVTGIRTPNGWNFREFVMTPDRSTVDEF